MAEKTVSEVLERCTKEVNERYDRRQERILSKIDGCMTGGYLAGGIGGSLVGGPLGALGGVIAGAGLGYGACSLTEWKKEREHPSRSNAIAQCVGEASLGQMSAPPPPEGAAQASPGPQQGR